MVHVTVLLTPCHPVRHLLLANVLFLVSFGELVWLIKNRSRSAISEDLSDEEILDDTK